MKRSEVNQNIDYAMKFMAQNKCRPPPPPYWTPSDWEQMSDRGTAIFDNRVGRDITDF